MGGSGKKKRWDGSSGCHLERVEKVERAKRLRRWRGHVLGGMVEMNICTMILLLIRNNVPITYYLLICMTALHHQLHKNVTTVPLLLST